jgi:hypothetical protein
MVSQQAESPVIRARNQAMIRTGGEQGRAATHIAYQRVVGLPAFFWGMP